MYGDNKRKISASIKSAIGAGKRIVIITGSSSQLALYIGEKLMGIGLDKEWTHQRDTKEQMLQEMADHIGDDYGDPMAIAKDKFGHYVVVDGSKLGSHATAEDLEEMLFGTKQIIIAKAPPQVKIDLLTACWENNVVPVLTSSIRISGTPLDRAKKAVKLCRGAGMRAILLTSKEKADAREQAVELGIFTGESKTMKDVCGRLNTTEDKVWPREAPDRIVTRDEMKAMSEGKIRKVLSKYHEVVFSGLTPRQKDLVELCCTFLALFVVC